MEAEPKTENETGIGAEAACMLIYSLMLSDVEQRTYEFGMLRALGFNTKNIILKKII